MSPHMNNYSLLFYAKKTKSNPEFSTIYLRVTINGKRSELSTGNKILTSDWCSKSSKVIGKNDKAKTINTLLEHCKLEITCFLQRISFC